MGITKGELDELLKIKADIEKISTISSDGKTLITRIPKEIRDLCKIKKGSKIRWLVDAQTKKVEISFVKE